VTDGAWAIRVPASSANLGAGFDVLGMALTLHAEVGLGDPPAGARPAEPRHPATVAFARAGGVGEIWVRSPIPMGRGLGFSGAVRVGGALAARVQRDGRGVLDDADSLTEVFGVAGELEGHTDNAAASLYGGVVVTVDGSVVRVPLAFDPAVVVWVPDATTTSTDPDELLAWGTRIAGRYMGADLAEQYGRRNAVPPEMVVRVTPTKVVAKVDVAD